MLQKKTSLRAYDLGRMDDLKERKQRGKDSKTILNLFSKDKLV